MNPFPCVSDDDESLWAQLHINKSKVIYLCTYYKPLDALVRRLDHLSDATGKILQSKKNSHPLIVAGSDFNMGDKNWLTDPPSPTVISTSANMSKRLDFIKDNALTQHVTQLNPPCIL